MIKILIFIFFNILPVFKKKNDLHKSKKYIFHDCIFYYFINTTDRKNVILNIANIVICKKNILLIKHINYLFLMKNSTLCNDINKNIIRFGFMILILDL